MPNGFLLDSEKCLMKIEKERGGISSRFFCSFPHTPYFIYYLFLSIDLYLYIII